MALAPTHHNALQCNRRPTTIQTTGRRAGDHAWRRRREHSIDWQGLAALVARCCFHGLRVREDLHHCMHAKHSHYYSASPRCALVVGSYLLQIHMAPRCLHSCTAACRPLPPAHPPFLATCYSILPTAGHCHADDRSMQCMPIPPARSIHS